jgi:hypothetical protein
MNAGLTRDEVRQVVRRGQDAGRMRRQPVPHGSPQAAGPWTGRRPVLAGGPGDGMAQVRAVEARDSRESLIRSCTGATFLPIHPRRVKYG